MEQVKSKTPTHLEELCRKCKRLRSCGGQFTHLADKHKHFGCSWYQARATDPMHEVLLQVKEMDDG
jgi:hypothetical protein